MAESSSIRSGLVVAIDGPSGAGKSTVARDVARALGLRYLDTGAMYRALTWQALRHRVEPGEVDELVGLADQLQLELSTDPSQPRVAVDGVDVTAAVRTPGVTAAVSAVSAVPGVRRRLVARQRDIIGDGGIVVEGRDIGTVVAPDAAVKVFLTAASGVRALRRARETDPAASAADRDRTRGELGRRDAFDSSRAVSPLVRADDAVEVDSTGLTVEQVVGTVLALVPQGVRA